MDYRLQLQLPRVRSRTRAGQGSGEERCEACFCPFVSFIKWEKGICERGGRKGDLAKGFLGQIDFRKSLYGS